MFRATPFDQSFIGPDADSGTAVSGTASTAVADVTAGDTVNSNERSFCPETLILARKIELNNLCSSDVWRV
ncbi:hypothetical protein TW80_13535 [Loktanella sp. S4079]|nr:hypothetical protein TW80_13535 [Loktanella sp. S4079]